MGLWSNSVPVPELVTPPTTEPVSRDEAKNHCRIDWSDEDDQVDAWISAAREYFEASLDRQLAEAQWALKLEGFWPYALELPYPPLVSVDEITYIDINAAEQTLSPSIYQVVTSVTPGQVVLAYAKFWPVTRVQPESVTVTYTAGPSSASELVRHGIKLLVGHWYANREAVTMGSPMTVPLAVDSIIQTCRSYRF